MKRYVFDGQSLGVSPNYDQSYGAKFMALARPGLPFTIANIGGTSYAQRTNGDPAHASKMCSPAESRVDTWFQQHPLNVMFDDGGANEYGVVDSPPMTWQEIRDIKLAYCNARRAAGADYIIGMTQTPGIDQPDTEFWFSASELAEIEEGNAEMVANPAAFGYNQVVDTTTIPELQDPYNTMYYYDGVHYTSAATTLIAQKLAAEVLV